MLLAGAVKDIETQDVGNDERGIRGAVYPIIGELIGGYALRMQRAEACFIAEKWPAGHGHAAREKGIDRGIKPDDGDTLRAKKFGSALLRVSSAAEREHGGFFHLGGAAEDGAKLLGFEHAKSGFAVALEKLGDTQARGLFDAVVEIDKAPGELAREKRAYGGLAGAHESGETNNGGARRAPARNWILRHDAGAKEINRASGCELYH
jgi:hypothetical protein